MGSDGVREKYGDSAQKGYFAGLTTLDYVYYVDEYPDNNSKVRTEDYKYYVGGPAANAAITYSLLGGKAVLMTCLGKSAIAEMIKGILSDYGVEVLDFSEDDSLPNVATIVVDREGNRTIFSGQRKQGSAVVNIKRNLSMSDGEILRQKTGTVNLADRILSDRKKAFCLFDLNQQELALQLLEQTDCPVVLDAGSWKTNTELFLKKADIVISSEGFRSPEGKDIFEIKECERALKAMTRGEKDILTEGGCVSVCGEAECADSLAAGDIFHGAFCYAYFDAKKDFISALEFARDVAGESVKYRGPREWRNHFTNV